MMTFYARIQMYGEKVQRLEHKGRNKFVKNKSLNKFNYKAKAHAEKEAIAIKEKHFAL
jgi:hypothetical protein